MSKFVTADAQFGIENVLRPYEGFEAVYQGQAANRPIMFTKPKLLNGAWGDPLDPMVNNALYEDRLVRGLSVPYGSRVVIKIPLVNFIESTGPTVRTGYKWVIWWRSRNLFDYRNARIPWHFPSQSVQSLIKSGVARVPIPSVGNSIIYSQPESANVEQVQHLQVNEVIQVHNDDASEIGTIIAPDGIIASIEQGLGVTVVPFNSKPSFASMEVSAIGDEFLIGAYRDTGTLATWDFPATVGDAIFANAFGTGSVSGPFPFFGPIVSYGSAP